MDFVNVTKTINEGLSQLVPFFRIVWICTLIIGAAMIITALVLKRNPERKKSPWIVGGIGLLMAVSSGSQLIASLL